MIAGQPVDHGRRDRPRVALTFDDGPGEVTDAVLRVLAAHDGRATFNVLGERVRGRERWLRRMVDEGHEIGNHAWDHRPLTGRPLEALRQVVRTGAAIERAIGERPRTFRAPYGAVSPGVVRAAAVAGLTTVGWDVDPRDYERPGTEELVARVLAGVRPGSIVLLHDARRAEAQTAEALDRILPALHACGLEPVTVSDLLAAVSQTPSG